MKEEIINKIKKLNGRQVSSDTLCVTKDSEGNELLIIAKYDNADGQRKYQIVEVINGERKGVESPKSYFLPSDIDLGKYSKIERYISNLCGNYNPKSNNILQILTEIEEYRLIKPDTSSCINSEVISVERILDKLQQYMLDNPSDKRLVALEIKGEIHVGIVGRNNQTAYNNFRSLINEIAPENNVKTLKSECNCRKILRTDMGDAQKTVGKANAEAYNLHGDKMYSFKFADDVMKQIKENYDKEQERQKNANAEKQTEGMILTIENKTQVKEVA